MLERHLNIGVRLLRKMGKNIRRRELIYILKLVAFVIALGQLFIHIKAQLSPQNGGEPVVGIFVPRYDIAPIGFGKSQAKL